LQAAPGQWPGPSPGTSSPPDCPCPGSAYRIAFGPRAGRKVLTLRGAMPREAPARQPLCADIDGFSLHAAVRVEADDRKRLEQLSRYITRPALSDERVQLNAAGQVELKLNTPWRDGTTQLVMSPLEFMQRLAAGATEGRPMGTRATAAVAPDPFGARVTWLREVSGPPLREPRSIGPERKAQAAGGAAGAACARGGSEAAVAAECEVESLQPRPNRISWARLLKRVPQPPGAGSAATAPRAGARGGARLCSLSHSLNDACRHIHHAPGLQRKTAAGAATHDVSARLHQGQGQP